MDSISEEGNPDVVRNHLFSAYSLNRAKDHLGGWDYAVVGIYFLVIIITGIYVSGFLHTLSFTVYSPVELSATACLSLFS